MCASFTTRLDIHRKVDGDGRYLVLVRTLCAASGITTGEGSIHLEVACRGRSEAPRAGQGDTLLEVLDEDTMQRSGGSC